MGSRQNIVKHITYFSDFKMLDVRTPIVWNKPKSKIYNYNQEITGCYYKPMLDYVDSKERQGIFFEKPSEKIHLPEAAELALTDHTKISRTCGSGELKNALIKGYSQMAKESHLMTGCSGSRLFHQIHAPHVFHSLDHNQTSLLSIYQVGGGFFKRNKPLEYARELAMLEKSSPAFASNEKFYQKNTMNDQYEGFLVHRDPQKMMETV